MQYYAFGKHCAPGQDVTELHRHSAKINVLKASTYQTLSYGLKDTRQRFILSTERREGTGIHEVNAGMQHLMQRAKYSSHISPPVCKKRAQDLCLSGVSRLECPSVLILMEI